MDLGSAYFGIMYNTFCREVLLKMLWPPVITRPAGLYMNGGTDAITESGGLDLKSMLRSCNMFL